MLEKLKAPFPYFGGKSRIAHIVWQALGDVDTYMEPFFGSGAVCLARPHKPRLEVVNDKDGFVSNFWRAVQMAPDEVAYWADWPSFERDKHARHYWLITEGAARLARLQGDPLGYDAQVAGWWVWGRSVHIAGGWCSADGSWYWDYVQCAWRRHPRYRKNANGQVGISHGMPEIFSQRGVASYQKFDLDHTGYFAENQVVPSSTRCYTHLRAIANRFRNVRILCGDWERVAKPSVMGLTKDISVGLFLDPPYASVDTGREMIYAHDSTDVAVKVSAWARQFVLDYPKVKIVIAGHEGDNDMPGWSTYKWQAHGGYSSYAKVKHESRGTENASREMLWLSPACNKIEGAVNPSDPTAQVKGYHPRTIPLSSVLRAIRSAGMPRYHW